MTTVLLAEDHTLVRAGIRLMLESAKTFTVVAEVADGRAAVQQAEALSPDLALLDVSMPGLNGVEAARQIPGVSPQTRILMLSMRSELQYVVESLRAGAHGYVLKDVAFEELQNAIATVLRGETYLSPALAQGKDRELLLQAHNATMEPAYSELDKLTKREREILQLIAEGHSGPEIARDLGLSARTVETHRVRIMMKLDLHSIADLTRFAIRNGVCSTEY